MNETWENILLEIGLFVFLGVLYYFYQKRKIESYEKNKRPLVMGFILQCCLTEKKETSDAELDSLIEALDDYLQNKSPEPPLVLLKAFTKSPQCSQELFDVITQGFIEIEESDGKK